VVGLTVFVFLVPLGFFLRDFVPGMSYRTDKKFKPGVRVELNQKNAEIMRLGLTRIILKTEEGNVLIVPYSKIRSFSYRVAAVQDTTDHYCFQFDFIDLEAATDAVEKIRRLVVTSPWIPAGSEPGVRLIDKTDRGAAVEVRFHTLVQDHALMIEKQIKSLLNI
jgi:hypothetical protein